jgi:hypothetical protein
MRVATTLHHPTCRAAGLWLLALALLGGCVSQDYYRLTAQSAASGAMQGVRDGIPGIEEPLRQTLRGALVDDPALKEAARDPTRSAVEMLEVRLGSPEMRRQVDAPWKAVKAAGGTLEAELRRVATASVLAATTGLRDSLERDVTPAAERLAGCMGEELVASVVKGLEGPFQKTMLQAGRSMSQALIRGAAEGADDPINQAGFGGLTSHVMLQAKTLTIVAKSINNHQSGALKDTIKRSTHDNYVGP